MTGPVHDIPAVPLTSAEVDTFANMTENFSVPSWNAAYDVGAPFQQFETLSVESFSGPEAVQAIAKAVGSSSLAAEAHNYDALATQNHLNLMRTQTEARLFHESKEDEKDEALV